MTIQDIVESGVELGGGDPSLYTLVKKLLNAWIKHQATIFPWITSMERSQGTEVAQNQLTEGQGSVSLPLNYYRFESLVLTNANGVTCPPILVLNDNDWDNMIKNPEARGEPRWCYINHNDSKIELYPIPSASYTYYIRYRKLPVEIDAEANSNDTDLAVEANTGYPSPYTLIRVAKAFTLEWRHFPEEAMAEWQHIGKAAMETQRGALDRRREAKKMRLNTSFFRARPYWQ